jgi:hypothetical protein
VTCFQAKQATRSRHVSHAVLSPSVLWHNRQTEAYLVLGLKPRNRRGDFKAQITKPELPVLRTKLGNPSPPVLRPNRRKQTTLVLRLNQETRASCLHVHGADHTRCHLTSRLPGHRVPDLCDHSRSSVPGLLLLP